MLKDRFLFKTLDEDYSGVVKGANSSDSSIKGKGNAEFFVQKADGTEAVITLKDALFVPDYSRKLISVAKLKQSGITVNFGSSDELKTTGGTVFPLACENNLFLWKAKIDDVTFQEQCFSADLKLWHDRMGHNNFKDLKNLEQHVIGMQIDGSKEIDVCDCCELNKSKRKPIPKDPGTRATSTLEIVHTDVLGPITPESLDGHKYAIGFVDSFSRYAKVYFMKSREEVLEKFQQFCADLGKPQTLVSDGAKEFLSNEFKKFCRTYSIRQEVSAPYTPEENGKIERLWQTTVNMARCMIDRANMSKSFWTYSLHNAFYVKNFCLHKVLNKTPYQVMYNVKPNLSFVKLFGCKVFLHKAKKDNKFDRKAIEGVFLGSANESKTFIIGLEKDDGSFKTIKSRNVTFKESEMFSILN